MNKKTWLPSFLSKCTKSTENVWNHEKNDWNFHQNLSKKQCVTIFSIILGLGLPVGV